MSRRLRFTRSERVVRLGGADSRQGTRPSGLTEEERRILLAELAEISAELDDLQTRTQEITTRVNRAGSATSAERRPGAA
jgi:hypothetical protein